MSEYVTTESSDIDWHHGTPVPIPPRGDESWRLVAATFRPTFSLAVDGYDANGRWREGYRTEFTGRMVWLWEPVRQ